MVTSCYEATYIALAEAVAASVLLATYRIRRGSPSPAGHVAVTVRQDALELNASPIRLAETALDIEPKSMP